MANTNPKTRNKPSETAAAIARSKDINSVKRKKEHQSVWSLVFGSLFWATSGWPFDIQFRPREFMECSERKIKGGDSAHLMWIVCCGGNQRIKGGNVVARSGLFLPLPANKGFAANKKKKRRCQKQWRGFSVPDPERGQQKVEVESVRILGCYKPSSESSHVVSTMILNNKLSYYLWRGMCFNPLLYLPIIEVYDVLNFAVELSGKDEVDSVNQFRAHKDQRNHKQVGKGDNTSKNKVVVSQGIGDARKCRAGERSSNPCTKGATAKQKDCALSIISKLNRFQLAWNFG